MTMNSLSARYLREFGSAMPGYLVVLPISIALLLMADMPPALRAAAALLPVLPMLFAVVTRRHR